ncbi:MAG: DNA gyrase subunit A [Candidatus Andersenbacteria bacterium RIFCSPHIGHO2_12_FULL_45_11b]|uniref:DNA gyrase subunit A n=1 Tax=Candidatus Andersenbacteria bacterium RIFCSPHIGHO2_12_FULL_45_11b TaxID=1797282 RepID=A0A1G1XB02_9BACT|nr:MAG: DNA gyrase subunit A [Candidatus Andersenbacteria bacterium RIFCSPHIGHO2_12_FULL_45_11b]
MAEQEEQPNFNIGKLVNQGLSAEIQKSYLDYAMSVIVSRALPDVRDGMKPVARRILYSMWRQNLRSAAKFRKSANVVGDVMAKYHPHGDASIYDALARLVQDFSLRYPLIDGQGNWGNIDGDSPAAMRYTEARLMKISDEMLSDIAKGTVNFIDNYDGSKQEPVVLPSAIPQFLVNGTVGIAVGMATNVPPHNIKEVCLAASHVVDTPDATVSDLMKFVQGPDFPTGAAIYNKQDILQAYATGRGGIVTRAIADIEEAKNGSFKIIVHEIPYLVNKSQLITKIAENVKADRIQGIRDLRDESDKDGIRIVIELKRDAYPKKVLNQLFDTTDLQKTFHVNMLALVDGGKQPKVLTLKDALLEHINHRKEVITRRTQFDLDRARERAHILEGLKKALDHIDEVIAIIRKSKTRETAHVNLINEFKFSDAQATAILEMRLSALAGLERKRVEDELREKRLLIKELEGILKDPKKIAAIIKADYQQIITQYGDLRRTRVVSDAIGDFSQEDLVPDDPTIVTITRGGYIKRLATSTYQVQRRGGKGVKGMTTKEEDVVDIFLATTTHKQLLFFTNQGRVFSTNAYEIPETARAAKGQAIQNFLELASNEKVTAVQDVPDAEEPGEYLVMVTRAGVVKKTSREDFLNIRRTGLKAITLNNSDTLEWVAVSSGSDNIMIVTKDGQAILFPETDIRPMGRVAAGVRGIKLKKADEVVAMHIIASEKDAKEILVMTKEGFGKRTPISQYRMQKRGGMGIKTAQVTSKTGPIIKAVVVESESVASTDILVVSERGQVIRVSVASVSQQGRSTQGVRLMRPSDKSGKIATFTIWREVEGE